MFHCYLHGWSHIERTCPLCTPDHILTTDSTTIQIKFPAPEHTSSNEYREFYHRYADLLAKHERVLQMLELAVAQLQYTQNLFKAEDLDNSVVLSMIAHEIAQIERKK